MGTHNNIIDTVLFTYGSPLLPAVPYTSANKFHSPVTSAHSASAVAFRISTTNSAPLSIIEDLHMTSSVGNRAVKTFSDWNESN